MLRPTRVHPAVLVFFLAPNSPVRNLWLAISTGVMSVTRPHSTQCSTYKVFFSNVDLPPILAHPYFLLFGHALHLRCIVVIACLRQGRKTIRTSHYSEKKWEPKEHKRLLPDFGCESCPHGAPLPATSTQRATGECRHETDGQRARK